MSADCKILFLRSVRQRLPETNEEVEKLGFIVYYGRTLIGKGVIITFFVKPTREELSQEESQSKIKGVKGKRRLFEFKAFTAKRIKIYLDEIAKELEKYLHKTKNRSDALISFIPSKTKIPQQIAEKLSTILGLEVKEAIFQKKSKLNTIFSKTGKEEKFNLKLKGISPDKRFIVIDDEVTGSTICEVLTKLYQHNQKINYFFIIEKCVEW
ncbi:MAG: hypothetical protein C6I01_02130 [Epsilonproteobacteria bacterium]|nr:hypothetical protein [Campylobacterota bacterium]NPA89625.1 phosphoribosyltransferase [Campylobacterota bacterium]